MALSKTPSIPRPRTMSAHRLSPRVMLPLAPPRSTPAPPGSRERRRLPLSLLSALAGGRGAICGVPGGRGGRRAVLADRGVSRSAGCRGFRRNGGAAAPGPAGRALGGQPREAAAGDLLSDGRRHGAAARRDRPALARALLRGEVHARSAVRRATLGDVAYRLPAAAFPAGPRSTTRGMTGAPGASSSRPPTTTCSPGFTPFVTSTNPGVRTP